MIIDTHCHYNLAPLAANWQSHWQQAQAHGVTHSVIVGTNLDTSALAVTIAAQDTQLVAAVGIHPSGYQDAVQLAPATSLAEHAETISEQLSSLSSLITHSSDVVAIGETGLDYYRLPTDPTQVQLIKSLQQQAFSAHVTLAFRHHLPLIIHVRDQTAPEGITPGNAYWDTLAILEQAYLDQSHSPHPHFILHCVSGPLSYVTAALKLGAYLGMAGNLTYKNADHLRSLIKLAPAHRLLLETDAPFLPPHPYRGQTCEPWMISQTAQYLADNVDAQLPAQAYENALPLFQLH